MRISVVINPSAGKINKTSLVKELKEYFFRCHLSFYEATDLCQFFKKEIKEKSSAFIIAGGDGTFNFCLQKIMKLKEEGWSVPPVRILSLGTANDLANEIGSSKNVKSTFDTVFKQKTKNIDVLRVSSRDKISYMITNGGIGIPCVTAEYANTLRSNIYKRKNRLLVKVMRYMGSFIYTICLLRAFFSKKIPRRWRFSIQVNDMEEVSSDSKFIFINNQNSIASGVLLAPETTNDDGLFNLTIFNAKTLLKAIYLNWSLRKKQLKGVQAKYEARKIKIKSSTGNKFDFFGDGEVLLKNTEECTVELLQSSLPLLIH